MIKLIQEKDFLDWATDGCIELDIKYDPPQCLVFNRTYSTIIYSPNKSKQWKHWTYIISSIFKLVDTSKPYWIWKRYPVWSTNDDFTIASILLPLGLKDRFRGGVICPSEYTSILKMLILIQLTVGVGVADDLFVIPENRSLILNIDHHDAIIIETPTLEKAHEVQRHLGQLQIDFRARSPS